MCPDGTEAGDGDSCHNCPRGMYRRLGFEEKCTPCPKGRTTVREKSVSESDCIDLRKCNTENTLIDLVTLLQVCFRP